MNQPLINRICINILRSTVPPTGHFVNYTVSFSSNKSVSLHILWSNPLIGSLSAIGKLMLLIICPYFILLMLRCSLKVNSQTTWGGSRSTFWKHLICDIFTNFSRDNSWILMKYNYLADWYLWVFAIWYKSKLNSRSSEFNMWFHKGTVGPWRSTEWHSGSRFITMRVESLVISHVAMLLWFSGRKKERQTDVVQMFSLLLN